MFRHHKAPLIVGILVLFAVVGYVAMRRSSPGELARPHAEVAGSSLITDCDKCHGKKTLALGCLACHSEIADQLSAGKGYHAFLLRGRTIECARCHSDHNGPDFPLCNKVSWEGKEPKDFTHPETDFRLAGRHRGLACEKCHAAKDGTFALAKFPSRKRPKTYLGLDQACAHCHKDVHAGGLAADCGKCHGQESFRPASGFDHGRFFALKGPHAGLECRKCHPVPASPAAVVKASAFPFDRVRGRSCWECHSNPHRVKWSAACEACHKAEDAAWSAADSRPKRDQHAVTGFRLVPPHEKTSCVACHAGASFAAKYPDPRQAGYKRGEKACEGCHRDPHLGQFAARHPRCAECHGPRR